MENNSKDQLPRDNQEYRNLATNTVFSFLLNYSSLFFTFIYSFLMARLFRFQDDILGFLIIATSFIMIIVTISSLLPPGLNFALNYYIPHYLVLKEKSKIKSLIKNSIIIKLIFLVPVFIISLLFFILFGEIFQISLEDRVSLLYIMSPLIFINSLNYILNAINRGFSRFNYNLFFLIVKNAIHIIPLLLYFLLRKNIQIEMVALIILISGLVPFILNSLFIFVMIYRIEPSGNEPDSFKSDLSKTFKYGSFIGLTDLIDRLWKGAQIQGIGFFKSSDIVMGYNISFNYQKISDYSTTSFNFPLLTSLTTLNAQQNYEQASLVYRIAYKMTLFLLLLISGILFFSVEFTIDFVFLEDRLIYSNLLKLIVIASIFKVLGLYLQTYLNAQHKVKISLILKIIYMIFTIPLFFIGLIYLGVEGAIIYGLIVGNIISIVIQIYATYRFAKIKLNIKKIIVQYLTFFTSLVITMLLKEYIFKDASLILLDRIGLSLIKNFDLLSILSFLFLFLLMNVLLKTVTSSDIIYFESYFQKDRFFDKIIKKILGFLKKFTRN